MDTPAEPRASPRWSPSDPSNYVHYARIESAVVTEHSAPQLPEQARSRAALSSSPPRPTRQMTPPRTIQPRLADRLAMPPHLPEKEIAEELLIRLKETPEDPRFPLWNQKPRQRFFDTIYASWDRRLTSYGATILEHYWLFKGLRVEMLLSQFDKLLTDENFQRDVLDHVLYVELRFAGEPPLTRHPATEQILERTASLPPEIATVPRPISPATSGGTASSIARAWPVQMATNESSGIASPSPADAIPMQSSQDAVAANNAPSTEEAIIPEVAPDETSTSAAPSSAEMTAAQVAQDATRMDVAPPAGAAMALRMAPVEVRTSAAPARAEARLLEYATGRSMETYEIDESRSSISSDPYYSLKLKGGIIALLDTGVNVVSEQTLLPETEIGQFDCLNDDDPYCALRDASRDVGNDDVDAVPGIPHGDGTRSAAVITSRNMTDNQVDATPDSPGDYRGVTGIQINSYKVYKAHGCDSDDPCCIDTGAATKALHALADGLRPDDQRPEDAPPFHDVIPAARTSTCPSATCKG